MTKKIKNKSLVKFFSIIVLFLALFSIQVGADDIGHHPEIRKDYFEKDFLSIHENTFSGFHVLPIKKEVVGSIISSNYLMVNRVNTTITGYSSTVDQTNSDPLITASGEWVRDGIVAANFLSFGTEIRIPEIFGDKIFIVKDRMNSRYTNRVDIWFPSRQQALNLGIKNTYIEVLEKY